MKQAIINLSLSHLKDAPANCVRLFWSSGQIKNIPEKYERSVLLGKHMYFHVRVLERNC